MFAYRVNATVARTTTTTLVDVWNGERAHETRVQRKRYAVAAESTNDV